MKDFWQKFPKPMIGLAPMDGYSDSAFRQVCKLVNPDIITYTEFTSTDGLVYNSKKVIRKLWFMPQEKPIIAQIFGKNVESFKLAAKICEDKGFDGIDLNMGCPAKKVMRSEHGFALRDKPDLARQLIEVVASSTSLPVSVKTRLGWGNADDLVEFGKLAEQAGCNMLAIHGRTFREPYKTPAHFDPIYELKKVVKIPVLGNGGITSIADGMAKLGNLDGFLIGQASFGNPWVFGSKGTPQNFGEKIEIIKKHAELLILTKGERVGTREIRKHLVTYTKNFSGAREYRRRLVAVESLAEIYRVLEEMAYNQSPRRVIFSTKFGACSRIGIA